MSFYTQFKPTSGVSKIFASTGTAVSTNTGVVTIWSTATLQEVTDNGNTTTNAIYAGSLYSNGALVITTATLGASTIVTQVIAGTDISVNTTTGNVTVSDISTLESVTGRGATSSHSITLTNTSTSTGTDTGALVIAGGVGIGGDLYVGGTIASVGNISLNRTTISPQLIVQSDSLDPLNSATIVISSTAQVGYSALTIENTAASGRSYTLDVGGNNRSLTGGTSIDEGNLTVYDNIDDAYRLILTKTGDLLLGTTTSTGVKLEVNGAIAASTGTFSGPITVQSSLVETTVTQVNNTSATQVDSFIASVYRSCKCFVQIQDVSNFHLTEIVLLHDDGGQVYKSEYGIISTGGEKGTFTADLQLDGIVRLYYTADSVSDKTIKVVKTAVAA